MDVLLERYIANQTRRSCMMYEQVCVEDFHKEFNISIESKPCIPSEKNSKLRVELIEEELTELKDALEAKDVVEVADALGDLMYVVLGCAVSCGIDVEPVFMEIHRSNMTKKGGYKAENGKWMKPDTFVKPNLLPILIQQGYKYGVDSSKKD